MGALSKAWMLWWNRGYAQRFHVRYCLQQKERGHVWRTPRRNVDVNLHALVAHGQPQVVRRGSVQACPSKLAELEGELMQSEASEADL